MDEPALIRQILAGNHPAFRILVVRYQRPVFRFLSTFRLSRAQTEELAQEAFLRVFRNLSLFDPGKGATFSSWLFTIVKNLAANEIARASHQNELSLPVPVEMDHSPADGQDGRDPRIAFSLPSSPAQMRQDVALEHQQRRSLIRRAVAALPDGFRNAVALAYLDELSMEEIAAVERCSVGTVKSRIFRGKKMLREALLKQEV